MIEYWEIVVLIACFFGSGFFSGSEAILMSIGPDRASQLIDEGGQKGRVMKFMVERPNEILTTILVGNNIVNIFAASLNTSIASRLFESDAIGISVGVTTLFILIFGEIIPKTFARTHAERLAVFCIQILQINFYLLYPIVMSMVAIIEKILGENAQLRGKLVQKDDLEYMISRAEKEKTMDSKQIELLNSILEFPTIKVKDVMIPRSQIKSVDKSTSFKEIIKQIREDTHSRYPVCIDGLEDVIGCLHVKDLSFVNNHEVENFDVTKYIKEPFFVYEHMKINAVFDHMNRKKVHLALVKDEQGIVVGLVTLEDIIEEIFGDIQDEHDEDEDTITEKFRKDDLEQGIILEGAISLRDLHEDLDIQIPLNDNYSTLAGFILDMLGDNYPGVGQIIFWEGYSFEILDTEDTEIKSIRIKSVDGEKHVFSKKEAHESNDTTDSVTKEELSTT